MPCKAIGYPKPHTFWQKDGQPFQPKGRGCRQNEVCEIHNVLITPNVLVEVNILSV